MNVIRGRRRTFSSILGVLLAVTFIASTFIAIDSSTRAALDAILDRGPEGDFTVSGPQVSGTGDFPIDVLNLTTELVEVDGVQEARPAASLQVENVGTWSPPLSRHVEVIAIDPSAPPQWYIDPSGPSVVEIPRKTAVLSAELASELVIGPGDSVYLSNLAFNESSGRNEWWYANFTLAGIRAFREDWGQVGAYSVPLDSAFTMNIKDLGQVREQLGSESLPLVGIEVWIDRDRFIDPYDLDASSRNVVRLFRDVQAVAQSYGTIPHDNLGSGIATFEQEIVIQRVQYLMLSVPVILLGLYLGAVGVDMGHAERRRELAVLRTRGAGRREVILLLMIEAVFGGLIAAAVGLMAGIALSRVLLTVVSPSAAGVAPRYEDIILSVNTVLTVAVLSVLFMAAISHRSAKRTSGLPVVETLHHYAPGETRTEYKPNLDAFLVGLGMLTYSVVLYSRYVGGGFVVFLIGFIFFALVPVAPILLVVGATRLLTRSTGRVYDWASRVVRPVARNLHHVIRRNLARNPRRSSNVAMIIALGLAFGIFSLSIIASQQAYQRDVARASVGADAVVFAASNDPTLGENLRRSPGVVGVSRVLDIPARPLFCCADVFALEPETFFAVAQPEPWYFGGLAPEEAVELLATDGTVLISKAFHESAFVYVGDRIAVETSETPLFLPEGEFDVTVRINVTVGGVVRAFPGLPNTGGLTMGNAIYGSIETFSPFLQGLVVVPVARFYVDLAQSADWERFKEAAFEQGVFEVLVYEEELERTAAEPLQQVVLGFMGIQILFIVAVLTAGLGLVIYASSLERDVEFASISARGSSGWQTTGLLTGEALSIMIIAIAIGSGIGLLAAFLTTETLVLGPPGIAMERLVPFSLVLPTEALLLVGITPLAMIIVTLVVSWRIARLNVSKVLKLRGG